MARNVRTRQTLLLIVLSPLLLVVLVLLVLALPFLLAYRFLLRLVFEILAAAKGRRMLFVYSRSPVWQDYVERNWLPRLADHAMVLNWSDRASWKGRWSFAVWVFRHWAPRDNFNPMAIVFPPFRPAKRGRLLLCVSRLEARQPTSFTGC